MAVQLSIVARNARLDAIESTVGVSPKLRLYSGAQPANCAAAASGTLLREMTLPADWANAAANGSKALLGTWTDNSVGVAGTAGHYRLYDSAGTTCHEQGSVTITGGGGDLALDNNVIAQSQVITITTWTKTDGNA
jgi:hypothetical protein